MRQFIVICPDCRQSMQTPCYDEKLFNGGFTCRCLTRITFTVDSRYSNEAARLADLKEKAKNAGRNK
jgi:hypothetical protein